MSKRKKTPKRREIVNKPPPAQSRTQKLKAMRATLQDLEQMEAELLEKGVREDSI